MHPSTPQSSPSKGGMSAAIAAANDIKPFDASKARVKASKASTPNSSSNTAPTSGIRGSLADGKKAESTPQAQSFPNTAPHKAERDVPRSGSGSRPRSNNPAIKAFDARLNDLDSQIATVRTKMDQLRGDYSTTPGDKNASSSVKAERDAIIEQLKAFREQQKSMIDERRSLAKELADSRELLKKKGADLNAARDRLPYRSIAEIDRLITEHEHQLETRAFKLSEERQLLQEVSKLKKAKKALQGLETGTAQGPGSELNSLKLKMDSVRAKLQTRDDALDQLRTKTDELTEQLKRIDGIRTEHQAKQANKTKQLDGLKKELETLYEQKRTTQTSLREARAQAQNAYLKAQAQREEQARRRKIEDEIDKLESLVSGRSTGSDDSVAEKKWNECSNLLAYFTPLVSKDREQITTSSTSNTSSTKRRQPERTIANDEFEALKPKEERDLEHQFTMSLAVSGGKKKGNATAKNLNVSNNNSTTNELGRIPMPILAGLADLGLLPPTTLDSVHSLIANIKQKQDSLSDARNQALAAIQARRQDIINKIEALKIQLETPVKINLTALKKERANSKLDDANDAAIAVKDAEEVSASEIAEPTIISA